MQVGVPAGPGVIAKLTQAVFELGGNILSFGTFDDKTAQTAMLLLKVVGVEKEALSSRLASIGDEVIDARFV